jgi:hypothetical protein
MQLLSTISITLKEKKKSQLAAARKATASGLIISKGCYLAMHCVVIIPREELLPSALFAYALCSYNGGACSTPVKACHILLVPRGAAQF